MTNNYRVEQFEQAFIWWNSYLENNTSGVRLDTREGLATLAQKIAGVDVAPTDKVSTPHYRRLLRLVQEQESRERPDNPDATERVMDKWATAFLEQHQCGSSRTHSELVTMLTDAYSAGWNGAELGYGLEGEADYELRS